MLDWAWFKLQDWAKLLDWANEVGKMLDWAKLMQMLDWAKNSFLRLYRLSPTEQKIPFITGSA